MEWINLCVVQISVFEKLDNAWVSPDKNVENTNKWYRTEFARSGMDQCRLTITEITPTIELLMNGKSRIYLPAEDFAELQINDGSGRTFGFYFIDGDEASAFVAIVASTLSSIRIASLGGGGVSGKTHTSVSGKRKSLSQFHDVNQAVERAMDSPDGNYTSAVAEQQGILGRLDRLGSSALDMLKAIGGSAAGSHFSSGSSGGGNNAGSGARSPMNSHKRNPSSESNASSIDGGATAAAGGSSHVFSRPAFFTQKSNGSVNDGDSSLEQDFANVAISQPSKVKHDLKVSYDLYNVRYVGLPPEWKAMNRSFGLTYEEAPKIKLPEYPSRIPAVLEMLKRYFLEYNGKEVVGIFRLAASKEEIDACKLQINTGCFNGCDDINIISNLIKIYFREMPKSLLNCVPEKSIHKVAETIVNIEKEESYEPVVQEMESFEEPHKSLFYWLLDLMSLVVMNEDLNKMSARNIAIVLAPNLFSVNTENAMYALTMSQKVADFTTKCLAARLRNHFQYSAKI